MNVPVTNQKSISSDLLPDKKLFKQESGKSPTIKISSQLPSTSYQFILCNFLVLFFSAQKFSQHRKHHGGGYTDRRVKLKRMPVAVSTYLGQTGLPKTTGWGQFLQFILRLLYFINVGLSFPPTFFFFFPTSGALGILRDFTDFYTSEIIRCP